MHNKVKTCWISLTVSQDSVHNRSLY